MNERGLCGQEKVDGWVDRERERVGEREKKRGGELERERGIEREREGGKSVSEK